MKNLLTFIAVSIITGLTIRFGMSAVLVDALMKVWTDTGGFIKIVHLYLYALSSSALLTLWFFLAWSLWQQWCEFIEDFDIDFKWDD